MLSRERKGRILERSRDEATLSRARWLLADRTSRALSRGAGAAAPTLETGERLERISVPVGDLAPLHWLRGQRPGGRLYWAGREAGTEVAAVGIADLQESGVAESSAELHKRLAPLLDSAGPDARYYGGERFNPEAGTAEEWSAFGAHRFVLPRFELHRKDGASRLVCNLVLPRDVELRDEILEQIEDLELSPVAAMGGLPRPISRSDAPDRAGWRQNVERALESFVEGKMDKVVLARRAEFGFEEILDPALLVESLKSATPGCFHFFIEPEEGTAFVGASPERLYRRDGSSIKSEAVAGTRPRGDSEADDDELREELLESEKDRMEHSYVRDSIRAELGALCSSLEVDERISEMKLTQRRHLVTGVRGTLREGISDADILEAMHPTPAVGGYPREEALHEIASLEPFDRGWWAGPVGWIGADGAEFAVGIRSGLVRGNRLALFSGAGIVGGSTPDGEWAEIEQKIGDFTRILGLEPDHSAR